LPAESRMVQNSALFSGIIAILPLVLIADGTLGRIDGIFLICIFLFYVFWLFSKEERFKKVYEPEPAKENTRNFLGFLKNSGKIILSLVTLLLASHYIVKSAVVFSGVLNVPIAIIGVLIVGLGDTLPEMYFSVISARKSQNWMILGDLIGSVIYTSTFVLGLIAIIYPIKIVDFSPLVIARIFLIIATAFFIFIVRTGQKITKKEGIVLLGLYIVFLLSEIFFNYGS